MRKRPNSWTRPLALFGDTRIRVKREAKRHAVHRALHLETLEDRRLLATGTFARLDALPLGNDLAANPFTEAEVSAGNHFLRSNGTPLVSASDNFAIGAESISLPLADEGDSSVAGMVALGQGSILPHLAPPLITTGVVPQLDLTSQLGGAAGASGGDSAHAHADGQNAVQGIGSFQYQDSDLTTPVDMFYGGAHILSAPGGLAGGDSSSWIYQATLGLDVSVVSTNQTETIADFSVFGMGGMLSDGTQQSNYTTFGSNFVVAADGTVIQIAINNADGINIFLFFAAEISDGDQVVFDALTGANGIVSILEVAAAANSNVSASISDSIFIFGFAEDGAGQQPNWFQDPGTNPPPNQAPPLGSTSGPYEELQDFNGNQVIDQDDVDIWLARQSVPKVTGVTIKGPNPLDGLAGSYDIPVGSGDQIRTVPIGGADILVVEFSEAINQSTLEAPGAFEIHEVSTGTPIDVTSSFVLRDLSGTKATWDYTPATSNDQIPWGQYVLKLADTITDLDAVALDGEWAVKPTSISDTGTSEFPSGDGTAGGGF